MKEVTLPRRDKRDKPRRRTQEERSSETRERLLRATIDVLLKRGYAGLTTAQVEEHAGVSSGARVHHYRSKADLVIAATSYIYEHAGELGQHRAQAASHSAEPIRGYIEDCLSIYFDRSFVAAYEVVVAARTDPPLMARIRPVLDRFHTTMKKTWLEALVKAGCKREQAESDLGQTLNFIRGMALNRLWHEDASEHQQELEDWCQQVTLRQNAQRRPTAAPRRTVKAGSNT
jgi:AcrR family transcriptional regulator